MNLTDSRYKDFALVKEMLETADVIRNFDFSQTANMAKAIEQTGAVFLTGEGSSRIFPAKNMIYTAMKIGADLSMATDGSIQAREYDLKDSRPNSSFHSFPILPKPAAGKKVFHPFLQRGKS